MDCIDFIYKISAPISVIITAFLTYYIFKLSTENSKKDSYFQFIIDLYYKIEDDSRSLFEYMGSNCVEDNKSKQYCRRISVNCTLMVYYLKRFPGYYKDRTKFERILIYITYEPTKADYYDILSGQFEKFCWGIRSNKKKASHYTFSIDREGYPDENRD